MNGNNRAEARTIFWLCFIMLAGLGMSTLFDFDLSRWPDQQSYWSMAHFDFHTSLHRKYRFVIPLLAAGFNALFRLFHFVKSDALSGDFSLKASFYLVNLTIASLWCSFIYRYCRAYGIGLAGSLAGLLAVVTSRWSMIHVGTPHTDILFCLAVICTLYGIHAKSTAFVLAAIIIGPFSKESFLFTAPVLFFSHLPKARVALYLLLSGAAVFCTRWYIDRISGTEMTQSISADTSLISVWFQQFSRLRVTGYYIELFATFGLWWLLPLLQKIALKQTTETVFFLREPYILAFLLTSAFQIVLNGEFARMMYMLMPVYAVIVGFAARDLLRHYQSKGVFLP